MWLGDMRQSPLTVFYPQGVLGLRGPWRRERQLVLMFEQAGQHIDKSLAMHRFDGSAKLLTCGPHAHLEESEKAALILQRLRLSGESEAAWVFRP